MGVWQLSLLSCSLVLLSGLLQCMLQHISAAACQVFMGLWHGLHRLKASC